MHPMESSCNMLLMSIMCPCICTKTKLSLKQVLSLNILQNSSYSST